MLSNRDGYSQIYQGLRKITLTGLRFFVVSSVQTDRMSYYQKNEKNYYETFAQLAFYSISVKLADLLLFIEQKIVPRVI